MQARLQSIFEAQYELKLEEKVEIRTRKETRVGYRYNPITGTGHTYTYQVTVQYEYKIPQCNTAQSGVDYVAEITALQMTSCNDTKSHWSAGAIEMTCLQA